MQASIDRLSAEDKPPEPDTNPRQLKSGSRREGALIACHGLAGGTGSTTLAVNLAWELAELSKSKEPRVCLLDFDMQYGSVSTYLDLPRREVVMEMLSETESLDEEVFGQALLPFQDKLQVLTAPSDMRPLEIIHPEEAERGIKMAGSHVDVGGDGPRQTPWAWH